MPGIVDLCITRIPSDVERLMKIKKAKVFERWIVDPQRGHRFDMLLLI